MSDPVYGIDPVLAFVWATIGAIGLVWLTRRIQKRLSVLDAFSAATVGSVVGVPILVIALIVWLVVVRMDNWLTTPRW